MIMNEIPTEISGKITEDGIRIHITGDTDELLALFVHIFAAFCKDLGLENDMPKVAVAVATTARLVNLKEEKTTRIRIDKDAVRKAWGL